MDSSEGTIAYVFGDFRLDANQRVLTLKADGRVLPLTVRVIDTLLYLVQHRGELLDKATLMTAIWPNVIVEENNLNQSISILRRVLGDTRDEHRFIVTVPNRGYRFVADVSTETDLPSLPATRSRPRAGWFIAAAAGGALIVLIGYLLWGRSGLTIARRSSAQDEMSVVVAAPRTIAVLPFADMSPNQDQGYFADGLAEELSDRLSRVPGLGVIGRTSAFSFKGKNADLRTISKALGVHYILEGSVRKAPDQLRITAQIVDANGTRIWSETYDKKPGDVFAIQDAVAKSATAALSVTLHAGGSDVTRGGTRNVEAYDAYLAGIATNSAGRPDDVRRGIQQLERAVALDPEFARAWSTLALVYQSYGMIPERGGVEWSAKTLRAASRSLELAPNLPSVQAAAALISMQRRDWTEAERRLQKARDFATGSENVWQPSGWFCLNVGRPREAAEYFRRAKLAEPLLAAYSLLLAAAYEMSGDLDQADLELIRGANLVGDQIIIALGMQLQAMTRGDRAQIEKVISSLPPSEVIQHVMRSHLDEPQAALAELRRLAEDPAYPKNTISVTALVFWAAYFGDPELSLRLWRKFPPEASFAFMIWRPIVKDMRRLPGFKDLVRDLGLVDYWRASGNWNDFCRPLGKDDFDCT